MELRFYRPIVILVGFCFFGVGCFTYKPQMQQTIVNKDLTNFTAYHDIHLTGVNVSENLTVNGNLIINNGQYNNVYANGKSNISNTMIKGQLSTNGNLKLNKVGVKGDFVPSGKVELIDTIIEKPINAKIYYLRLVNSKTKDIYIPKGKHKTHIILEKGSVVSGNITFASGKGVVEIQVGSSVTGSITGTVIEPTYLEVNLKDGKTGGPKHSRHGLRSS